MGAKKLWVVKVATDVVVYAESSEKAERTAISAVADLENYNFDADARVMRSIADLPDDYNGDDMPWGHEDYTTIADLLAAQSAEPQAGGDTDEAKR